MFYRTSMRLIWDCLQGVHGGLFFVFFGGGATGFLWECFFYELVCRTCMRLMELSTVLIWGTYGFSMALLRDSTSDSFVVEYMAPYRVRYDCLLDFCRLLSCASTIRPWELLCI